MSRGLPEHLRVRPRGTNGRPSCRFCHGDVQPPKQSYCSELCMHEFRILNESVYAKALVLARDAGICAECGLDTMAGRLPPHWRTPGQYYPVAMLARNRMGAFECDHILEVARGGTSALENLQTLCVPCHRAKTKRFAAERATARRASLFLAPALALH